MKYKLLRLLLLLSFTLSVTIQAQEKTDEELVEIVRLAMEKRNKVKYKDKEAIKTFRTALKNLSDAQKIRGFYQLVLYKDKVSKYPLSSNVAYDEYWAFSQDPHLITDYSELKKLIREEQDPRKYLLLSCMCPRTTKENNHNFIPDLAHMLFKDGRVIRYEGESTFEFNHDVSILAYQNIFYILKAHGYHVTISGELTHDQEVVLLAKWLKKNWKGCENMVIPEKFLKLSVPEVENLVKPIPQTPKTKPIPQAPQKKSPKKIKPQATQDNATKTTSKPEPEIPANEPKQAQKPKPKSGLRAWLIFASVIAVGWLVSYMFKRKS